MFTPRLPTQAGEIGNTVELSPSGQNIKIFQPATDDFTKISLLGSKVGQHFRYGDYCAQKDTILILPLLSSEPPILSTED